MEENELKKNQGEFVFKMISLGFFVLSILILIGIKMSSDISLKIPTYFVIFFAIIFIVSLFSRKIYSLTEKLKEKESNPEPLTLEQVEAIEKKLIKDMWNYPLKGMPLKRKSLNINNSVIYERHVKLYREVDFGREKTDEIIILINATYPNLQPSILPSDCSSAELNDAINKISKTPYSPENVEETEISTDRFGGGVQRKKLITYVKNQNEKAEDVV